MAAGVRDAATDYLVTAIRQLRVYDGLIPRPAAAVKLTRRGGTDHRLRQAAAAYGPTSFRLCGRTGVDVPVSLTDKFPNTAALGRLTAKIARPPVRGGVGQRDRRACPAGRVPDLFTAFHRFRPADVRAILAAACTRPARDRHRRGLFAELGIIGHAVVGPVGRAVTDADGPSVLLVPPILDLSRPRDACRHPVRWGRFDPPSLHAGGNVGDGAEVGGDEYEWEAGFERLAGSPIPIPYLIGVPLARNRKSTRTPAPAVSNPD